MPMPDASTPPDEAAQKRAEAQAIRQTLSGFGVSLAVGSVAWLCDFFSNPFLISPTAGREFANAFGWALAGNLLGLPLIAVVLFFASPKRNFALGFLLGTGLCWLLSFATCAQRLKI